MPGRINYTDVNDPDIPYIDDVLIEGPEGWKIRVLNRIDEEYGCDVSIDRDCNGVTVFCEIPEWEPFSNRCYDHTPGVMHSWDMW
jgi:hypothetical protein